MTNLTQQQAFYTRNRAKLRQKLKMHHKGAVTVIAGSSFMQLSADRAYPFEQEANFLYLTGLDEPGLILVLDNENEYLIVPERNTSRIAFEGAIDTGELISISGIQTIVEAKTGWANFKNRLNVTTVINTLVPQTDYVESIDLFINPNRKHLINSVRSIKPEIELNDIREELTSLRLIKSSYEIKMTEQAIKQTQKLINVIEKKRTKAKNEQDLLAEVERTRIKLQLKHAYEPIIASGSNAVTLHYVKNNSPLDKKGLLLLDIGLRYNGYCADISRTVSFEPNSRHQAVYDAVLEVQEYAIGLLKPGVMLKEYEEQVHQMMGEKLKELGLIKTVSQESVRQYYPHATSHFLGLDVHDVGGRETALEPGMLLTVEPGIYIPEEGIGVRIEDNILITKEGSRNLTNKLPKNLASLTIQP